MLKVKVLFYLQSSVAASGLALKKLQIRLQLPGKFTIKYNKKLVVIS
jgi:hypothetical protein